MKYLAMISLGLAIAASAVAQDGKWKDRQGKPVQETEAMRSANGLAGSVLVTADADLREKWRTPSGTAPHFNAAPTVARGKSVTILTFFGNPRLDAEGKADLTCDIDLVEPGGKSAMHQAGLVCFRGVLQGGPNNVYLAAPSIDIGTTASDTPGTYTVRVTLRDNLRKTVLPLKTSFVLK
jgi:hypothetical protein